MTRELMRYGMAIFLVAGLAACGEDAPAEPPARPERPKVAEPAAPVAEVVPTAAGDDSEPGDAVSFYSSVVFAHGKPRGAGTLTAVQAMRRRHAQTERSSPTLTTIMLQDSRGRTLARWKTEALGEDWHQVTHYDDTGTVVQVDSVTEGGRTVERRLANGDRVSSRCKTYRRDLNDRGQVVIERCLGDGGAAREDDRGIHEWRYEVNAAGHVISERAFDVFGRAVPIAEGREGTDPSRRVFSRRYELNPAGQVVEESIFDADGRPTEDAEGVHRRAHSYNAEGLATHLVQYEVGGNRTGGPTGVAERRWIYDEAGKLKELGLLNAQGQAAVAPEGYGRVFYEVDNAGRPVLETYADETGRPVAEASSGASRVAHRYVEGRRVETQWQDGEGKPKLLAGKGYAMVRFVYDEAGRVTEERRFGVDGLPVTREAAGYAIRKVEYGGDGRILSERFLDGDEHLVEGPDGWAIRKVARGAAADGSSRTVITRITLGPDEKPVHAAGVPWAKEVVEQNDAGHELSRAYFDALDGPTIDGEGRFHRREQTWSAEGDLERVAWFGADGQPTVNALVGAQVVAIEVEGHGREVRRRLLDAAGAPQQGAEGWGVREQDLDELGRVVEVRYLVSGDEAVGRASDNAARVRYFYGAGSNLRSEATFDAVGDPLHASPGGYARVAYEYDGADRLIATEWLDASNKPVNRDDVFYARMERRLDKVGRVIEERFQDATRSPVTVAGKGYSGKTETYDDQGRRTREAFLGTGGQPTMTPLGYAQRQIEFAGDRWAVASESFMDPRGRPAFHTDGYAGVTRATDWRGRVTNVKYMDALGNPVVDRHGAAERRTRYDGDLLVEERTYDVAGELTRAMDGTSGNKRRYDGYGRLVEQTAYDSGDQPMVDERSGCTTQRWEYTATGEVARTWCLDATGHPMLGRRGFADQTELRDLHGWTTETAYHGLDGEALAGPEGWTREAVKYDARGLVAERSWFGKDDQPMARFGKAYKVRFEYDGLGRVTKETWVDLADLPVRRDDGWAARTTTYDPQGRVIEETRLGADGAPVSAGGLPPSLRRRYSPGGLLLEERWVNAGGSAEVGPDGWASERRTYDARGRMTALEWLDASDRPGRAGGSVVGERYVLDRYGRVRETTTIDATGAPADRRGAGGRAWAIAKTEFDDHGRVAEQSWFDAEGRPVGGPEGLHLVRFKWTDMGQVGWQQRYGAPNRPAPGGWARQAYTYDQYGRLVLIEYQNELGRAAPVWNGVGQVRLGYGAGGRLETMNYLDLSGGAMDADICYPGAYCGHAAVAEARYLYGADGEPTRMELYDKRGKRSGALSCDKGECF
jgi:YD repeat-containing protein